MRLIAERYMIERLLGHGLVTASYVAYDSLVHERVVIKMLRRSIFQNEILWAQVRMRLHQAMQLDHPHIVPILDGGPLNDSVYWVQPYLQNGSLAHKMREQMITPQSALDTLSPIADALAYAGQKGIIHGHLQLSNILFDRDDVVKVADFALLPLAQLGDVPPQSMLFVSPEQHLTHLMHVDTRADVYALGGIFYAVVNNRPPFSAQSAAGLTVQHLLHTPPSLQPPTLSARLQTVQKSIERAVSRPSGPQIANAAPISAETRRYQTAWRPVLRKALAKHPAARFQSVAALTDALRTAAPSPIGGHSLRLWLSGMVLTLACLLLLTHNFHIAQLATPLRQLFGVSTVTQLETVYLSAQDQSNQVQVAVGLREPSEPWPTTAPMTAVATAPTLPSGPIATTVGTPAMPTIPPVQTVAMLPDLPPFGALPNEGVWQPYLFANNQVVAKRTFLQPDAARPLSLVALVAIDLQQVSLNYVWGRSEPQLPNGQTGSGFIPERDRAQTIATFNGGFLSTHGNFGARSGNLLLEPRHGLGTVAIRPSGEVVIGRWGETVRAGDDWVAWRQNAPLILADGQITPAVYNTGLADWGGTINGEIVTWRSALGINAAGTVLYYAAGPGLSMPALAGALERAEIDAAMLLDINAYWVHFAAQQNGNITPLFPNEMETHLDRYFRTSDRDFFYLTTISN